MKREYKPFDISHFSSDALNRAEDYTQHILNIATKNQRKKENRFRKFFNHLWDNGEFTPKFNTKKSRRF